MKNIAISVMKVARIKKDKTQEAVAKKLGVVVSYVGGVERGNIGTDADKAKLIASELGSSINSLFEKKKEKYWAKMKEL